MVRNVVRPAMNSVRMSVPCSLSPKYLSSIAAPGISLFAAAFASVCFARLAMGPPLRRLPQAASLARAPAGRWSHCGCCGYRRGRKGLIRYIWFGISTNILFEHDLIRKPVPTFRDHAPRPLRFGAGAEQDWLAKTLWLGLKLRPEGRADGGRNGF